MSTLLVTQYTFPDGSRITREKFTIDHIFMKTESIKYRFIMRLEKKLNFSKFYTSQIIENLYQLDGKTLSEYIEKGEVKGNYVWQALPTKL